jgi:sigma-B regulation protein RsbU (phosphoserine phosphatase)
LAKSARLTLRATTGELERLRSWLESLGESYQLSDQVMFRLDLCLTELVTNVINYAYPVAPAPEEAVEVRLTRNPANLLVEITDQGVGFDPVAYVPRPCAPSLEEAETGGRGLLLVRKFATQLRYRRDQECNELSFILPAWPEAL